MSFLFLLKKFLTAALLPPLLPLWVVATGLLLHRRRRLGGLIAWGGLLLALFLIMPSTVNLLTAPLESIPVLSAEDLSRGQAIVILGAGQRRHMPEYGGPTPTRLALERLRYGARLARASGLPVLLSGGALPGERSEASVMAEVLTQDFSVKPRWLEEASLDTADNARLTAKLLLPQQVRRIVLVTHAAHMRRSRAEFEQQGFEVFPAPTAFLSDSGGGDVGGGSELLDFLPSATAAYAGWYAVHEWLGIAALRLRLAVGAAAN